MLRKLLPLVALAGALALPIAGCGSDTVDGLDPSAAVAQAADRTAAVEGMHLQMTVEVGGQRVRGEGFVDPVKQQGHITMTIPGAGDIETVTDKLKIYMKLPDALLSNVDLPDGKAWIAIDLQKALEGQGVDLSSFMGGGATDPGAQLRQLKAMGDVDEVGTEDVGGVATTHYAGTVDLHEAGDVVPAAQRDAARRSAEKLIELNGGKAQIPTELWIDEDGHVRRMKQTTPTPEGEVTSTIEFTDFGGTEAIEVPPADETYDISDEIS
jgi:hypothetical protein